MEATGVYYEALAYHLHGLGKTISVVLPGIVMYVMPMISVST
jgi:transposase